MNSAMYRVESFGNGVWFGYNQFGKRDACNKAQEMAQVLGTLARVLLVDGRLTGSKPVVCYVYRADGTDMMGDAHSHEAYIA